MAQHLILRECRNGVLVATFNHRSNSNPMSDAMGRALMEVCVEADQDETIAAVVLTGGVGRYFSAGGDFAEVSRMNGGPEVDAWIDWVTELYVHPLSVSKPTIAAIDGFAVGIGFQLALCCDWRIATNRSVLLMPELEKGIGCTFGGMMLERALGRLRMTHIVYGCQRIDSDDALRLGLLDEVCPSPQLIDRAVSVAERLSNYPTTAMRGTKRAINQPFIDALRGINEHSKMVHRAAFSAGGAQPHFKQILDRGHVRTTAA
jgi:carboxymethylproline synthase